jgi:outer membrane protein OmpA-like peptidoglycan-associated protein
MISLGGTIFAQDKTLSKADKYFVKQQYSQAASVYEKYLKTKAKDFYASRQAALSYSKLGNESKAVSHWSAVAENNQATEQDKLSYARALLSANRAVDAKKVFQDLSVSKDPVIANWVQAYTSGNNFYEDSALCKVIMIDGINTMQSEYSPVFYKNHILYTTEPKKKPMRLFSPWKGDKYAAIYASVKDDSVSYDEGKVFNKQIQNKYYNGPLCFTPDDSTIYFTRAAVMKDAKKKNPNGPLTQQIFYSAINSFGLAHEEIKPFLYNSLDYNCMQPTISKDGKKLYFASDMPGTLGGKDIFVCEWKDGSWNKPVNLGPNINTAGDELYPHITPEGILHFASNGHAGMGGLDIFMADPTNDEKFQVAENAGYSINTQFDDFGIFILKEGNKGYLSSNRKSGTEDNDIYFFVNNKPRSFPAKIRFVDSFEVKSVPVKFTFKSAAGSSEETLDADKTFSTRLKAGKEITITASSDEYVSRTFYKNIQPGDSLITIYMRPKSRKCIEGRIYDKDNNTPLAGVKVVIYDEEGNKYLDELTDASGNYSVCKLPLDKPLYIGSQKKPDYFSNTDKFVIKKDSDIVKDIYAQKIVVGKAMKIDNIYFDKGKFNVRADAAKELDKLVRLMKDNPEVIIELSSHTDCNGPAKQNLTLSDKRAKAAAAYIISKAVDSKRIKGKGYGETKLVNDCKCEGKVISECTEEQHAQNRRAEIKVTGFVSENKTPVKKGGKK